MRYITVIVFNLFLSFNVAQLGGYQLGGIFKLPQDMLCKLVSPYGLLPCPFAWNNVCLGNNVPAAFLGSCGGWRSLERYAWVNTVNVDGMVGAEGWTVVGAIRSIHPFVEDVDSTAGSRREGPDLVNVWIGIGGVFHYVFVRGSNSSPFLPSSTPSSLAPSTTVGLPSLCIFFRGSWWQSSKGYRWSGDGQWPHNRSQA